MKTTSEIVAVIEGMYYQIPLVEDEKLRGYESLHRSEKDWGGHRQMIEGAEAELLGWLRQYLEPQEHSEGFECFKIEHHPWYPGVKIEAVRQSGHRNSTVRILPGKSRFLVFSHAPLESFPSPPPISKRWMSISERRPGILRETCRGCGESYTEDNMFDCPHCGGEYCWRCRDGHIAECSHGQSDSE